jgi:hypothetical protein
MDMRDVATIIDANQPALKLRGPYKKKVVLEANS